MKWTSIKSYHIAREMGKFIHTLPPFSFTYSAFPWLATESSDTANSNPAPDQAGMPSASVPLVDRAAAVDRELEELNRHQFFNEHMFYARQAELLAEKSDIALEASRPRFTADIQREIRRENKNHSPYGPNIRGPRPLGRSRGFQGSAMDIDTSFREPSMMNVDGPSFYTPQRPQPQRHNYAPTRRGPSITMKDTSFCLRARAEDKRRARKARGEPSIRIEPIKEVDPAVAAQAARDAEETQRIAAEHARRMNEAIQERIAKEQEAKRARAEAARAAEEARLAEEFRIAEEARLAEEAELARIAAEREEAARVQAELDKAQREAEARAAAEAAERRAEEERARAAKDAFHARLHQEMKDINAEPDITLRAFKMYEWKLDLIKNQTQALIDADIKFDITQLPFPMFDIENAVEILHRSDGSPVKLIGEFLLHERRAGVKGAKVKMVIHKALLCWHSDKMPQTMVPVVKDGQEEECRKLISFVTGYLNDLKHTAN